MAGITVLNTVDNTLREELSPTVGEILPTVDPVFGTMNATSVGVRRDAVGRDWEVKKTFVTSLSGAFEWRSAADTAPTTSQMTATLSAYGTTPPAVVYDTPPSFPAATEASNLGLTQRTIRLCQGNGNMSFPLQILGTDQMSASIMSYVAKSIKLTARHIAQQRAISFYATDANKSICSVASVDDGTSATPTITIGSNSSATNDRIAGLQVGMHVDIWDSTGSGTQRNSGEELMVYAVDPLGGTVKLYTSDGAGCTSTIVATDILVPKNSVTLGPSSLADWVVASGSPFGLSLTSFPQLKSVLDTTGGSLTESLLNSVVGKFDDAYSGWVDLDTILTTGGVMREFVDQAEDLGQFQRQGAALNLKAGFTDVGYTYNGRNFKWIISRYCPSGTLYIIKTGGQNLSRYMPPRVKGSGSNTAFDGEVEFFAPLGGSSGIFKHAHASSGATTEMVEAPFYLFTEIAPELMQGIKMTGLTENTA